MKDYLFVHIYVVLETLKYFHEDTCLLWFKNFLLHGKIKLSMQWHCISVEVRKSTY